jgi:molecular chaperone GrpE
MGVWHFIVSLARRIAGARNRTIMAETHHDRTSMPPREDGGAAEDGQDGEGDAQIRQSPPNAGRTEPPADSITEPDGDRDDADHAGPDDDAVHYEAEDWNGDVDETRLTDSDEAIEQFQRELASAQDRYLRLAAEFDNYRRRNERERADLPQRAQADVVKSLLDVIDDLGRVASFDANTSSAALLEGVRLVDKKLGRLLEGWGLEPVDPAGEAFDPNSMEAVAAVPAETEAEDDVVLDVFQKGYRLGDTLVRPARVRVKKYDG